MQQLMSAEPRDSSGEQPGPVVLRSKIVAPALGNEHLSRPRLLAALEAGRSRRLTLVVAPAGYGKSRLLVEWCRSTATSHPTAWLSLDAHDNDPTLFWTHLVHALLEAYPDRFGPSLAALRCAGDHVMRVVVTSLLNELWRSDQEVWLVLDDVHVIANPSCLDAFSFFLEQLPPTCHLVLASRAIPPLGLARLRARGQLRELGVWDLCFTPEEAIAFLNGILRLNLRTESVARLAARTEGWAAGLYLAALSLRDHPDPQGFVAAFAGQHRHLVDYFGLEVLERLSGADRAFLLQTAVLDQLSAPLCDALLDTSDAAQRLQNLAQQNLFVFPLDDAWQWYRYHPLFRDLLLAELGRRFPDRVAELQQRAAVWYDAAGDAASAMHHAQAAGDAQLAGDLFLAHAMPLVQQGRLVTATTWLEALPEAAVADRPALALASAWLATLAGEPPAEVERRIALAAGGPDEGPFVFGEPSLTAALALTRATWVVGDVGAAVAEAEAAVAACADPETDAYLLARVALGRALYLAGEPAEAQVQLEAALRGPRALHQVHGLSRALATLALTCLALGEDARVGELARRAARLGEEGQAGEPARRAAQLAELQRLLVSPNHLLNAVALGQVLLREGRLAEAGAVLTEGVEPQLAWLQAWPLHHALALLALVALHQAQGDGAAARARLQEARTAVRVCTDAGMLPGLVAEAERGLCRLKLRPAGLRQALSEGELRILRLLPSNLTQREIGRELYLSVNTVKAHTRNIYARLEVASRREAVARARALRLIA
jgi:LuxR family maltose regulon positive regulatory protein